MKNTSPFFSTLFLLFVSTFSLTAAQTFKVISFNIRYDNPGDKDNQWCYRKDAVIKMLLSEQPDVLGIQEGLLNQVVDIEKGLPEYTRVGVGRDDGDTKGEFSAIFFSEKKYELLSSGTYWLSTTPEQPSIGWDAVLPRIATWARLKSKKNGKELLCINTHFDHQGAEARRNSALLIHKFVEQLGGNIPVVLMGDFNASPDDTIMQPLFHSSILKDARIESGKSSKNLAYTFAGFEEEGTKLLIDHIFVKGLKVKDYVVNANHYGVPYLSDHFAVIVKLSFK